MNLFSQFEKFNSALPVAGPLMQFRNEARLECERLGWPSRQSEAWRYTNLKSLREVQWVPAGLIEQPMSVDSLSKVRSHLNDQYLNLVFLNGAFQKELSSAIPSEISWTEANDLPLSATSDVFESLQAAYFQKRYVLKFKKESVSKKPVHIFFVQDVPADQSPLIQSHVTIQVESRASAEVIESYVSLQPHIAFSNVKSVVVLEPNSKLSYLRAQSENEKSFHLGTTLVEQGSGSSLEVLNLHLGSQISRTYFEIKLLGEGATSTVLGACVGRNSQHLDQQTSIQHLVGHCTTSQLYKGLLDNESRSVFNGQVLIAKNSQKAFSEQLNNNLLLSSKAEADSKPQLEIYADDVKATHGSTVGQLEPEEVFYLQSRAISKTAAVQMLSYGFIAETLEKLSSEKLKSYGSILLHEAFAKLRAQ